LYWKLSGTVDLSKLPKDVAMHYQHYFESTGWQMEGSSGSTYYSKLLKMDSEWYNSMLLLVEGFMGGQGLPIESAFAIFNPSLINNFISHRELIKSRLVNNPQVFNSKQWQKSKTLG